MNSFSFTVASSSPEETKTWGARLGRFLQVGDVVLFSAHLGAGKTTFVQGVMRSFHVQKAALSPTFVLAQTLEGRTSRRKKMALHHLDFYRLSKKEIVEMGIQDYFSGEGALPPGIVLIEWADRCKEIWPTDRVEIQLRLGRRSTQRRVFFQGKGPRASLLIQKFYDTIKKK